MPKDVSHPVAILLLRHASRALPEIGAHVREGLPRMSGELLLFLAAGVLAAGIGSAVQGAGWALGLEAFGATEASFLLFLMAPRLACFSNGSWRVVCFLS